MAISSDSRYSSQRVYYAVSRDGKSLVQCVDGMVLDNSATLGVVNTQTTRPGRSFESIRWRAGDRMDALAYDLLGDSTLYSTIADSNYDILDPTALEPGQSVWVPSD